MIRRELLILVLISVPLFCGEVLLRTRGDTMSQNIRTITRIRTQADQLQHAPRQDRILIIGNSLTLEGLSDDGVATEFKMRTGREFAGQIIAMYGSYVAEWEWLLRNHFLRTNKMPTHLVLNVSPNSLVDGIGKPTRRLALIASRDDRYPFIPENHILPTFGHKCEFVLSAVSVLFSRARDIGVIVFDKMIPNYAVGSTWVNDALTQRNVTIQTAVPKPVADWSYTSLRKILDFCRDRHTQVYVVLMPRQSAQPLSTELTHLFDVYGVRLIDFQDTLAWEPTDFRDGAHLSAVGRAKFTPIYTRAIVDALSPK